MNLKSTKGVMLLCGFLKERIIMDIYSEKQKCCCFTGHRPHKLGISETEAKKLLKDAILMMADKGFKTFISGMAPGIDLWAAEMVLEIRKTKSDIFLLCASPYPGFENNWSNEDKMLYKKIIVNADDIKYISPHYTPYCFDVRNTWMVNHSKAVIAAYNGSKGGTKNTINYAIKESVYVHNILSNKVEKNRNK